MALSAATGHSPLVVQRQPAQVLYLVWDTGGGTHTGRSKVQLTLQYDIMVDST